MLKILNDKSIKYRRFSSIMIEILDKKFLFAIIILTSCNQKIESNTETSVDENTINTDEELDERINSSPSKIILTILGPKGISEGTGMNKLKFPSESTSRPVNSCSFI